MIGILLPPRSAGKVAPRRLAGGAGWGHGGMNCIDDSRHISIDVMIPETQNPKSGVCKMLVANTIGRFTFFVPVLGAVDLDDQPVAKLGKVDDIAIYRSLTSEVMSAPIEMLQLNPKLDFLWGHRLA